MADIEEILNEDTGAEEPETQPIEAEEVAQEQPEEAAEMAQDAEEENNADNESATDEEPAAVGVEDEIIRKFSTIQYLLAYNQKKAADANRVALEADKLEERVLSFLKIKDGASSQEIERILGMGVSALSETLLKMERIGLIERRRSDEDARTTLTFLTEKGMTKEEEAPSTPDLFAGFSAEDLESFEAYLNRMETNFKKGVDEKDFAGFKRALDKRMREASAPADDRDRKGSFGSRGGDRGGKGGFSRGGDRGGKSFGGRRDRD